MQSNDTSKLFFLLCICSSMYIHSVAQTTPDPKAYRTEKAVVLYAGGGMSYFVGRVGTASGFDPAVDKMHPMGSLRLMWHPGHLLHAGIETGWMRFYTYKIDDNGIEGRTEINATPILLVFSMPLTERFHVFTGSGIFLMRSILDYNGHVKSNGYNLGWMVAASYIQPLSKKFGLAYEAKWMNASGTNDRTLSLQVQLAWKIK